MNVATPSNERESKRKGARRGESRRPTRTCVGCGLRDDAAELLRLVAAEDEFAFDLAGGAFGRGAHSTLAWPASRRHRGDSRAGFAVRSRRTRPPSVAGLSRRAIGGWRGCSSRLVGPGRSRSAPMRRSKRSSRARRSAVVAVDAGGVATTAEVQRCIAAGRAMAWRTRSELGGLLGERSVAICAVRHAGIAAELKRMRVAADAGAAATTSATREGAECSRFPEAR